MKIICKDDKKVQPANSFLFLAYPNFETFCKSLPDVEVEVHLTINYVDGFKGNF